MNENVSCEPCCAIGVPAPTDNENRYTFVWLPVVVHDAIPLLNDVAVKLFSVVLNGVEDTENPAHEPLDPPVPSSIFNVTYWLIPVSPVTDPNNLIVAFGIPVYVTAMHSTVAVDVTTPVNIADPESSSEIAIDPVANESLRFWVFAVNAAVAEGRDR